MKMKIGQVVIRRAFPLRLGIRLILKWSQCVLYRKFFSYSYIFVVLVHLSLDLACVLVWKWKCVCWSCVCLCERLRGLRPVHSRGCTLNHFWSFPVYVRLADEVLTCRCVVICVSVGLCEDASPKTAKFSSLFSTAKNPPSLSTQLQPEKPPPLSPAVASAAILLIAFSTLYLALICTFFWSLANGVVPERWFQQPCRVNTSNKMTSKITLHTCRYHESKLRWPLMVKMLFEGVSPEEDKALGETLHTTS